MVKAQVVIDDTVLEQARVLLSGRDFWTTSALHKYGIGSIKFSDGPNGVRGEDWTQGAPSACVPCGTSLGASFDVSLVQRVGQLLGIQCRDKSVDVLLGPTMNMHRYALCGRNFESFSEDPLLTGTLAAAYVRGVQSQGVSACPKHFLGNEAEDGRRWTSSEIDEEALRETYLEPFRKVVTTAQPWCLMTAYNAVNGSFCSESKSLLSILRDEWKYDGVIVSDWFGTYSTAPAINAGLDLEMPGPSKFRSPEQLESAIKDKEINEEQLSQSIRRVVDLVSKTGNLGKFSRVADTKPERQNYEARPGDEATLKDAASAGFVLLQNNAHCLPLSPHDDQDMLVVGAFAKHPAIHGGGSASLRTPYVKTPLNAVQRRYPGTQYSPGITVNRLIPLPDKSTFEISDIVLEWYNGADHQEVQRFHVQTLKETEYMLVEHAPEGLVDKTDFSTRMHFSVTPKFTGKYDISLCGPGTMQCYIDGQLVLDVKSNINVATEHYLFNRAKLETRLVSGLTLNKGTVYQFEILNQSSKHDMQHVNREFFIQGCRFGLAVTDDPDAAIERAVTCARSSKTAIILVGTNSEWESEGFDRSSLRLPGRQDEMICRVADSCPGKMIVIVNSGSPVDMSPWADRVDVIVQAWFPGMEFGDALVELLDGTYCPSGRLPTTFVDDISMTAAGNVGRRIGSDNRVNYDEGRFLGYRKSLKSTDCSPPRFAFGHGLSYTTFAYEIIDSSTTSSDATDCSLDIQLRVTNTGDVAGAETVLLFVQPLISSHDHPVVELKAFAKTQRLSPGEHEVVQLSLSREAFSHWEVKEQCWKAEQGQYRILFAGRKGVGDWIPTAKIVHSIPSSFYWK